MNATELELFRLADEVGRTSDGVISYYFKDGKEIGYCVDGSCVKITREWAQETKDKLNMTRLLK